MAAKFLLLSPYPYPHPPPFTRPCHFQTTTSTNIVLLGPSKILSGSTQGGYHSRGNRHQWRLRHKRRLASSPVVVVRSSLHEQHEALFWYSAVGGGADGIGHQQLFLFPSSSSISNWLSIFLAGVDSAVSSTGYSQASYYTSLGLFVISVPGLWSLIKRSVRSKIVQKTFSADGEGKNAPNQMAGEILSFFTRNNFVVLDRGETITFEGMMVPSRSQAALLTFCTCISLASIALVLTITVPDVGNNWFWLMAFSPLAGVYYWTRASRKEQIKVKMIVADNGSLSEIIVQGDDQQVDQMRRELQLTEKGMIYVKGIFER